MEQPDLVYTVCQHCLETFLIIYNGFCQFQSWTMAANFGNLIWSLHVYGKYDKSYFCHYCLRSVCNVFQYTALCKLICPAGVNMCYMLKQNFLMLQASVKCNSSVVFFFKSGLFNEATIRMRMKS